MSLFELWCEGNLKEAQEDIELRNQLLGWNPPVPVPSTVAEATQAYTDPRVRQYVRDEAIARVTRLEAQIATFERDRQAPEKQTPEAQAWYKREIAAWKRDARAVRRCAEAADL
jgi:hypothetical protein